MSTSNCGKEENVSSRHPTPSPALHTASGDEHLLVFCIRTGCFLQCPTRTPDCGAKVTFSLVTKRGAFVFLFLISLLSFLLLSSFPFLLSVLEYAVDSTSLKEFSFVAFMILRAVVPKELCKDSCINEPPFVSLGHHRILTTKLSS